MNHDEVFAMQPDKPHGDLRQLHLRASGFYKARWVREKYGFGSLGPCTETEARLGCDSDLTTRSCSTLAFACILASIRQSMPSNVYRLLGWFSL